MEFSFVREKNLRFPQSSNMCEENKNVGEKSDDREKMDKKEGCKRTLTREQSSVLAKFSRVLRLSEIVHLKSSKVLSKSLDENLKL